MKLIPASLYLNFIVFVVGNIWSISLHAESIFSNLLSAKEEPAKTTVTLKYPPASLQQWYKPTNKRQVWLHTMFRLRREMQAIEEYAKSSNPANDNRAVMQKWIKRLDKDYSRIAEMVPEWEAAIKPRLLPELEMFAASGDTYRVAKTLTMIKRTCDDCHLDYQPLVTAIYRSPHYDEIKIKDAAGDEQDLEDNMQQLSDSVNRILIALDDKYKTVALNAAESLAAQLQTLGDSCDVCHKEDDYPRERILGKATQQRFETLQTSIMQNRVKDSQKLMGEIAVTVCARCHNTHRIIYDLREALISAE